MFDKRKRDDDRGQVGIGTLIVFIAMVLVAAIAAGVLINTAGFLQSGAQETGQQSSDQVTNRLQVVSAVGEDITSSSSTVGRIKITVKQSPGANNIDLSTTTLQFVHSSGSTDLVFGGYDGDLSDGVTYGATDASSGEGDGFVVTDVQDEDNSIDGNDNVVLNDPADRAQILISTGASGVTSGDFGEGDTATIQVNTQSGGTTELRLVVPETLSGSSAVNLN